MNKLLLCSGPPSAPLGNDGWFRVDSNSKNEPNLVAEIPPLPAVLKNKQWDKVALIHGIEHFYPWDAEILLNEIYSILRPGGVLILEHPDVSICAEWIQRGIDPQGADFPEQYRMIGIFGDPSHHDPSMLHRWGYVPMSIKALLVKCGFREDRVTFGKPWTHRPDRDMHVEAMK